jgi:hypothetical protein
MSSHPAIIIITISILPLSSVLRSIIHISRHSSTPYVTFPLSLILRSVDPRVCASVLLCHAFPLVNFIETEFCLDFLTNSSQLDIVGASRLTARDTDARGSVMGKISRIDYNMIKQE